MKFKYTIEIFESITQEESALIVKCLQNHPDTKFYTTRGNFGFALANYFRLQNKPFERVWSFTELDIIMKSFEFPPPLSQEERELKTTLAPKLMAWMNAINKEHRRLNDL